MTIKVELSIEQVADILKSMRKDELETLELLLDSDTEREILQRRYRGEIRRYYTNRQTEIFWNKLR